MTKEIGVMKSIATGTLSAAAMIFAALMVVSPTAAQQSPAQTWCYGNDSTDDQTIAGCAQVIQSGRENHRDLASAYFNRGLAYGHKGDFDHAVADYTQGIQLNPRESRAYTNRGLAYSNKGDFDRAIADYTRAIQLDPKDTAPYNNRGFAYKAKGDLDRAIADCTQAIQLDPTFAVPYDNRGNVYKAKGDFDRAIADYTRAIQLNPKDAAPYNNRGFAYKVKGELDSAVADYTQAIELNPKLAMAYSNRCWAYFGKGNNDQAIADCSQAIELNPKDPNGYFNRGRANFFAGALTKALADLNHASELGPKSAYVALWLDIANRRSNLPSRLPEATKQIDMTKWPAPVIRLYLGQLTLEAVLAAADDPDPTTKKGRVCEANFYGGELTLRRGAKDEATRLFGLATTGGPKSFIEYDDASAELKALGASH